MKEKLYTIPVNDAFKKNCECPLCFMKEELEKWAMDFVMGSSYMDDDVRGETSRLGFCRRHMEKLNQGENRLGLALIIKSYLDENIDHIKEKLSRPDPAKTRGIFQKQDKGRQEDIARYVETSIDACYICNKIDKTFDRYIVTVFHLYKRNEEFRKNFQTGKGFCIEHYGRLYDGAHKYLNKDRLDEFIEQLNKIYLENMKRLRDELDWFISKFDYRYKDEPWKNSKDAIPRAIIKTNSIYKSN